MTTRLLRRTCAATIAGAIMSAPLSAQPLRVGPVPPAPLPATMPIRIETAAEALVQDAREYARANSVDLENAMRRLRAQEESVPATDAIRDLYRDRLAGIAIEHRPVYRIVVLLTGSEPVPDRILMAGGMAVPIVFRNGARATAAEIAAVIRERRGRIRAVLPAVQGMGGDPRSGELVLMVRGADADLYVSDDIVAELEAETGVPVRIHVLGRSDANFEVDGGARVAGIDADGRRYACTTGFIVTDATRTGVLTAAHCPDTLTYYGPDGQQVPLSFVGQWGARYQDVQVHVTDQAQRPLFYVDTAKRQLRTLTRWRNRESTRAGDVVCHRGERTGYSCSQVELVDYAPPGTLCGGPCDPVWVTVNGPSCRSGDSGGPVFNGTVAFGILKGGSYDPSGACNFYYYMSTDFLPPGWSLLHE